MDRLPDITSPFRLDFAKTEIVGDGAEMIDCYARHRAVALTDPFSPGFWSMVMNLASRSTFTRDSKTDVARRERENPASAGALIGMALSRPPLARWLAERLNAPSITGFASGGIFRNWPTDEDFLNWHDDVTPTGRDHAATHRPDARYVDRAARRRRLPSTT